MTDIADQYSPLPCSPVGTAGREQSQQAGFVADLGAREQQGQGLADQQQADGPMLPITVAMRRVETARTCWHWAATARVHAAVVALGRLGKR